jgi:AcrR family transcriptional regulator
MSRASSKKPPVRSPPPAGLSVGERVRLRILDGAEELFAERGFFGASIRDITKHAGVRLAAVNYHFGTKEELFRDVILRRATVLNTERLRRLAAVTQRRPQKARVRAIVIAFVAPVLESARADQGFRNYCTLMAQVANSRLWALLLVAGPMNDIAAAFVEALRRVFPRAGEHALQHAYQFLLSATLYAFSDNLRLDSLTKGKLRSGDFDALAASLVPFATAGVASLCDSRGGRRSKSKRKR